MTWPSLPDYDLHETDRVAQIWLSLADPQMTIFTLTVEPDELHYPKAQPKWVRRARREAENLEMSGKYDKDEFFSLFFHR